MGGGVSVQAFCANGEELLRAFVSTQAETALKPLTLCRTTAERFQADDLRRWFRDPLGSSGFRLWFCLGRFGRRVRPEAHAKSHIRVGEGDDRTKRYDKGGGNTAERKTDTDQAGFLEHLQVPELMLQDNGHFPWVLSPQPRRHDDPGMVGKECQIEMVITWQAVRSDVGDGPNHHLPHGRFGPFVIR
jgi:hypothetical protein